MLSFMLTELDFWRIPGEFRTEFRGQEFRGQFTNPTGANSGDSLQIPQNFGRAEYPDPGINLLIPQFL